MEVERDNEDEGCLPSQLYAKYKERFNIEDGSLDHGSELQNLLSALPQQHKRFDDDDDHHRSYSFDSMDMVRNEWKQCQWQ